MEDRVRTNKAMGLHNLPAKSWTSNRGWMLAANVAADLDAWLRLLALHDQEDLADAEPQTMRMRIYHQAGRLARNMLACLGNRRLDRGLYPYFQPIEASHDTEVVWEEKKKK